MPITPYQLDIWSSNMAHIYQSLEGELIRLIIKRLNNGSDNILDWQREKLRDLRLFNKETTKYIAQATGLSEKELKRMFETLGQKIVGDIDKELPYDALPLPTSLDEIMKAYFDQVWGDINNYVNQTLLSTNYGYMQATTLMFQEIINKPRLPLIAAYLRLSRRLKERFKNGRKKELKVPLLIKVVIHGH